MRCLRLFAVCLLPALCSAATLAPLERLPGTKPRNIVFILSDDHRYDALGFMGHPFLETPHLDSLARQGVHAKNAFVTTSLCSPSRASILTGLYAHRHRVVDNNNPVSPSLVFFSEYLQRAGYATGFFGKWHMGGEDDSPQRGWDRWVSFRGQGFYLPPPRNAPGLNVDGRRVPQKGYITDELTDYALAWLDERKSDAPFLLYLSHKGVHAQHIPAERHKDRYKDRPFPFPSSYANTTENYAGKPMWVKNQRNSWHGVDFAFHTVFDLGAYYRSYCETLLAVDDSVGRVLAWLKQHGLLDSTLVVYMGDNGFQFGEHGLIDKRTAYEESMRVPLLLQCPELFKGGTVLTPTVANIDIAPTLLEAAGLVAPAHLDGKSFLPLARGESMPWRDYLLYEYYWERNYPMTPTIHALRGDRYKYIRYTGLWDTDELYDLSVDPREMKNLIREPAHAALVQTLNRRLFQILASTDGMQIPLLPDAGKQSDLRLRSGSAPAEFPDHLLRHESRDR